MLHLLPFIIMKDTAVLNVNLNKKLFWSIASLIILGNVLFTVYEYRKNLEHTEIRTLARAKTLKNYFMSMRYVYHQQFINSDLEVNETTVGFLPAHASTLISDKFATLTRDGTTIRNVSDRPRNPLNKADEYELKAIEYFRKFPDKELHLEKISQNGREYFNYTMPIFIDKYCMQCHGKREEVLPSIVKMYDTAYDYNVGDVRGVTSIKIEAKDITEGAMALFYRTTLISWGTTIILLFIMYAAINKITLNETKRKEELEEEVRKKTQHLQRQTDELEVANNYQKHLFSILRTVADCNQILITSNSINELLEKTAVSMHANTSFSSVKISVFENGELVVKKSIGLDEELYILPLEREVFENNRTISLKAFDEMLPKECKEKIKRHDLKGVYSTPLRKNHYSQDAIGVVTICTKEQNGFSKEEEDMISELAGDIGFAMNSFFQKDALDKLSFYDQLTNLPNQKLFETNLKQAFLSSTKSSMYGAVMFMDFDNFKNVNDLMGKEGGDTILKESAQRLMDKLERASMISRFSSDKFLILLQNLSTSKDEAALACQEVANELLHIMQEPFIVHGRSFYLTCSIGIVLYLKHQDLPSILLNQSEYAMRTAKENGKSTIRFYDHALQNITKSRSRLVQNLKIAVLENEFFIVYQKQVNRAEEVVGVEALVRWQNKNGEIISPAEFIPLAEESGEIKNIGAFVLKEAAETLLHWSKDDIKKEWSISVNVSPVQFRDENFVSGIKELLRTKSFNTAKLRLELTEGVFIDDQHLGMKKIEELNALGLSISIDDFGTGYSNLGYLKHLKIDELKIDQSFVAGLGVNTSDITLIKTIIIMGEEFGFDVIAEGVETQEQFEELKRMGCRYFQGYLFAKPCKADEL